MGFFMLAGLLGTLGYMGYFAKKETTAIIGDNVIQPTDTPYEDKQVIAKNFKLICKRGNAKTDIDGNPIHKEHYKPCCAYLQYQGFQQFAVDYFKKLYLEKYNKKYETNKKAIKDRHRWIDLHLLYQEPHETKIYRHWDYGDTYAKCEKMMNNWLWSHMVTRYNIVRDGISNVEIWTISAPPSVLKQLDKIYDEVCQLEIYNEEE